MFKKKSIHKDIVELWMLIFVPVFLISLIANFKSIRQSIRTKSRQKFSTDCLN